MEASRSFTLSPFGTGKITQVLHEGSLFNVYRAALCGQEVCLKTPNLKRPPAGLFRSSGFGIQTSIYTARTEGIESVEPCYSIAVSLLWAEAQIVTWTAGAWNHWVIGQGTWDGLSKYYDSSNADADPPEPEDVRFLPVLVLPYHRAMPLSNLSRAEQRRLFPRMLPALWTALCQACHGDLSESNILLSEKRDIFHIIDPGAILASSFTGSLYINARFLFTSNNANYPLLPPFQDRIFAGGSGLLDCVRRVTIHAGGLESRVPEANFRRFVPQSRPAPSDLLAAGLMYYRLLTNEELFLGRVLLPDRPLWQGQVTDVLQGSEEFHERHQKVCATLADGYVEREVSRHAHLTSAEKSLLYSLIDLRVSDRSTLTRLADDAL